MIKTIDVYKFFPVIILIFLSNQIFSQTRIEGEIILGALGTGNNGWYYEWRDDENNLSDNIISYQRPADHISICPNPFNPITKISYYLPVASPVKIMVYNMAGQKTADLVNEFKYQGEHSVDYNGQSIAGGVYFVSMQFKNQQITKKIFH